MIKKISQSSEAAQVRVYSKNGARFMFIPSPILVNLVVQGKHPYIKSLPKTFKNVILQNKPIRIEAQMAIDYYDGTSDDKNYFILDHGDIKVILEPIDIKKEN